MSKFMCGKKNLGYQEKSVLNINIVDSRPLTKMDFVQKIQNEASFSIRSSQMNVQSFFFDKTFTVWIRIELERVSHSLLLTQLWL